jgi:hypothetical protein
VRVQCCNAVLTVIKRECNQGANKSNHPKCNPSFRHAYHPTRDNMLKLLRVLFSQTSEVSLSEGDILRSRISYIFDRMQKVVYDPQSSHHITCNVKEAGVIMY